MKGHEGVSPSEARTIAEALADVLVERDLVVERTPGPAARVLDVSEVARMLGRRPAWVYAHAAELGAFRFGKGPKARLGFDVAGVERWKREHQMRRSEPKPSTRRGRSRPRGLSTGVKLIPYEGAGRWA
jgi:hypothetical protein